MMDKSEKLRQLARVVSPVVFSLRGSPAGSRSGSTEHDPSGLRCQFISVRDRTRWHENRNRRLVAQRLAAGERLPALMKGTPYWRAPEEEVAILNRRGYAVVGIDARGTGASFGRINIMFSDAEISDYGPLRIGSFDSHGLTAMWEPTDSRIAASPPPTLLRFQTARSKPSHRCSI